MNGMTQRDEAMQVCVEVWAWCVWSKVQMMYMWFSCCLCQFITYHPIISFFSIKSTMVYLFGATLPRFSWKRALNLNQSINAQLPTRYFC